MRTTSIAGGGPIGGMYELGALRAMGVRRYRLSPQACDMVEIAHIFRDALDERVASDEAQRRLETASPAIAFSNGFFHRRPGAALHRVEAE